MNPGASTLLIHTVTGPTSKMIVLRKASSSLCPNTGALAVLTVDGEAVASGNISSSHSLIQFEASAGSRVAAIVHTFPMFNGVLCVRLGELTVNLDECELVGLSDTSEPKNLSFSERNVATSDWYAWNNAMPPGPTTFHVVGEVEVPNPGVEVFLVPKVPQGISKDILLLDLVLVQRPGIWPQLVMWKRADYEKSERHLRACPHLLWVHRSSLIFRSIPCLSDLVK